MQKQLDDLRVKISMPNTEQGRHLLKPENRNLVGCFDKVDVEHIRNGQNIYSSEEK